MLSFQTKFKDKLMYWGLRLELRIKLQICGVSPTQTRHDIFKSISVGRGSSVSGEMELILHDGAKNFEQIHRK